MFKQLSLIKKISLALFFIIVIFLGYVIFIMPVYPDCGPPVITNKYIESREKYMLSYRGFFIENIKEGIREIRTELGIGYQKYKFNPCPVCLSGDTLIDTPKGQTAIKEIEKGMTIWTVDKKGNRQSAVVLETVKKEVNSNYSLIHIVLSDGRQLVASPWHPTADGRFVSDLSVGDKLDNAEVISLSKMKVNSTYDILPSGETGFYWANGIIMGSTLRNK